MKFENPEILFFLFLLVIPIIIHLFQLQRFKKIPFSNVKFLKEIEQQTRKSSKLKKLLILLTRLLLLASVIFAFSKPFIPNSTNNIPSEYFLYIDNSFSMQAKNENGELLQNIKNVLIDNLNSFGENITIITNDNIYSNNQNLKDEIINISYSPFKKDLNTILLQLETLKRSSANSIKNIILISDFQVNTSKTKIFKSDSLSSYNIVQLNPLKNENIAIDSVWIESDNQNLIKLKTLINSYHMEIKDLSVSLDLNNQLFGKSSVSLNKNESKIIEFIIPKSNNIFGKLTLFDDRILFDNTIYFSLEKKSKIPILSIGNNNDFLSKIYTEDEFNFTSLNEKSIDLSLIPNQNVVILNELNSISNNLVLSLKNHMQKDGNLVIIPSSDSDILSYNNLFSSLNLGKIIEKQENKKIVTDISYNHPFFRNVFQKEVTNFQYPWVKQTFKSKINNKSSILKFDDEADFLSEIKYNNSKVYWFNSPLSNRYSNFTKSPLVVPVFYNFSLQKTKNETLYYIIGKSNEILVKNEEPLKNVLHISNEEVDFIPLQKKTLQHIILQVHENPDQDGLYNVTSEGKNYKKIAFNYNRSESNLTYMQPKDIFSNSKNIHYSNSITKAIEQINDQNKNSSLWQLFIIFALLFLIIELLLQKLVKN